MDLQSTFYLFGIIFIVAWLVFLIGLIIFGLTVYRRFDRFSTKVTEKMDSPMPAIMVTLLPLLLPFLKIVMDLRGRKKA